MSIEKIATFPEIITIIIDGNNVISVTQGYCDIIKMKIHIQQCIKKVRKYDEAGYYNLARPEFVNEVITTFTNLELSKKDVIGINNFMDIQGFQECNRVWQLPDEIKIQILQMLHGFYIAYDTENWENFNVELIKS